jgi:hypothetical protein
MMAGHARRQYRHAVLMIVSRVRFKIIWVAATRSNPQRTASPKRGPVLLLPRAPMLPAAAEDVID